MLKIKTQFSIKIVQKTNILRQVTTCFSHQKTVTTTTNSIHNMPSSHRRLLHTDFNKIHDKNIKVIFLITIYPNNQNHVFSLLKMKSEI